jgi:hypothetical protein
MSYYYSSNTNRLTASPAIKPPMSIAFWAKATPSGGDHGAGGNVFLYNTYSTYRINVQTTPAFDTQADFILSDMTDGSARTVKGQPDFDNGVSPAGANILRSWHHVVVTIPSTGTQKVYVNGTLYNASTGAPNSGSNTGNVYRGTFTDSYSWTTNLGTLEIGGSTTASAYIAPGRMAEVGIWSSELSAGDVTNLYTNKYAPILVQNATLYAYWDLLSNSAHTGRAGSPEGATGLVDQKNALDLTATGAVEDADHPSGIVYVGGGGTVDVDTFSGGSRGLTRGLARGIA